MPVRVQQADFDLTAEVAALRAADARVGAVAVFVRRLVTKPRHDMQGEATAKLGNESAPLKKWDALPVFLNEAHAIENRTASEVELMIVGVARTKWALDTVEVKP